MAQTEIGTLPRRGWPAVGRNTTTLLAISVTLLMALLGGIWHFNDRVTTLEVKEIQHEEAIRALPEINRRLAHIEGALGIGDASKKGYGR